jgi:transcriptional regulator with XRE-family HTH domain
MNTLADLRRQRNMTQVQLAEQTGVDQRQISRAENGGDMLLSTLHRYVVGLGGRLDVFATFDDTPFLIELDPHDPTASTRLKRRILDNDPEA